MGAGRATVSQALSRLPTGPLPASTLPVVDQSDWSFELTATVNAEPERVMAWWFDPDRRGDFRNRLEASGATDISMTESGADGLRARDSHWKDRRGWEHNHHVETKLTPAGTAASDGDRFVAPANDVRSYRSPTGKTREVACSGAIEFVPRAGGDTEINVLHHHTNVVGASTRLVRWVERKLERRNTDQLFRERVSRCEAAVGRSAT
jgi:hypothetical protein